MYTAFQLAKKYLTYYVHAANGKGHGVHSPFVFDFIQKVLNDKKKYPQDDAIEIVRKKMRANNAMITVEDFGAGSAIIKNNTRKISSIASSSLKSKKNARLLSRIARYYKAQHIIELGTSFGITTAYLAATGAKVLTLEGAAAIAEIAKMNFKTLGLENITVIQGPFEKNLRGTLVEMPGIDLAFVDGNHRKLPTLQYFKDLLEKSGDHTVLIFDDIHWSTEMEDAWEEIKQHPAVTMTIDLFFIGIVLMRKEFKVKQHFLIRF